MRYLFVCTGNTCRSPMAEHLARKFYPENDYQSAGLFTTAGLNASSGSINALKSFDLDLKKHKSKCFLDLPQNDYDYIIPMTNSHKDILISLGVNKDKIVSFFDEIEDPYMCDNQVYLACAKQIKDNLDKLFGDKYDN